MHFSFFPSMIDILSISFYLIVHILSISFYFIILTVLYGKYKLLSSSLGDHLEEQSFREKNNRRTELRGLLECYILREVGVDFSWKGGSWRIVAIVSYRKSIVRNSCNIYQFILNREIWNCTGEMVLMT